MRELAYVLLVRAGIPFNGEDVSVLADDLATVEYEPKLDGPYVPKNTEAIFLRRLGGIGNLKSYMACIRQKGRGSCH